MRKALPFFISLLFLLMPLVEAQESKVSVAEAEDYRDIGITEKGFEVKDPYALPIYEPKSTSLLPFHDKISFILNSYLGSILSTFDVKEAFALRILFEDLEPILSFIGDLLSLPITLLFIPFLSIIRMIKAPLDIIQFLLSAILEPILSIPEDEIAIIERFAESFKDLFHLPSSLLKPIEFLVYNPDPFSGSFSLPSFSASAAKICRAIDFIPVLNIVKGFLTAYLLPLMKALILPFLSLFSPYRDLLNAALFPFSLSFILLRGIGSLIKDLLSLFCMPLLFLLRVPLTPLLILFNFLKHSLEGLKEFLRFFSLLVPAFPILLFFSFFLSVLISLLLSSGILLIPLAFSIAVTLFLSALLSAIAFFSVFLGGLILASLTALAACLISIMAGALAGLILGAAAGLLAGGIIGAVIGAVAGLIIGAVVGAAAAGALGLLILLSSGIAILPLAIAIFVALLPTVWGSLVSALGGSGAALIVGIITAVVMLAAGAVIGLIIGGPLGALLGGAAGLLLGIIIGAASVIIIGAVAGLILGIISAFLLGAAAILLTILFAFLIALIAGTAGLLIGSLPSFALIAAALLISLFLLPFSTLALSAIFSGISLLLFLAPALISITSPEIFRIIIPPELIELSKRIALLPRDAARVINGLAHLPVDLMRAIAVLDDTTQISGEVISYEVSQERIISGEDVLTGEPMVPTNTTTNATTTNVTTEEADGTEPEKEVKEAVTEPEAEEPPQEEAPEIPPELSKEHNVSTAMEKGKEFFIEVVNDTGELVNKTFKDPVLMSGGENYSAYKGLMDYGLGMVNDLKNLSHDLGEDMSYGTYADAYNKSVMGYNNFGMWNNTYTGDLAQDLEDYQKDREMIDNMLRNYAADGVITQQEAEDLRKETGRVRHKNYVISKGIENSRDALRPAGTYFIDPYYENEVITELIGEDNKSGLSQELIDYLQKDKEYLDERYRNLGGT